MNLTELHFQRNKAKMEARTLLDRAMTETRALTIAEQVQFDALISRVAELDKSIAAREALRTL